jgi:hypothetical protein
VRDHVAGFNKSFATCNSASPPTPPKPAPVLALTALAPFAF